MKKTMKTRVVSVVMACLMAVGASAGVASAKSKKTNYRVKGDCWEYGLNFWGTKTETQYYNPIEYHGTSVKYLNKGTYAETTGKANTTVKASLKTSFTFSAKSEYRAWGVSPSAGSVSVVQ